jgi:hypothetical protein
VKTILNRKMTRRALAITAGIAAAVGTSVLTASPASAGCNGVTSAYWDINFGGASTLVVGGCVFPGDYNVQDNVTTSIKNDSDTAWNVVDDEAFGNRSVIYYANTYTHYPWMGAANDEADAFCAWGCP